MTFDEYQLLAKRTGNYAHPERWTYPVLGLAGEAGELVEKFKKHFRKSGSELWADIPKELRDAIRLEMGDQLWYISEIATRLDFSLSEIANANLVKLLSRQTRGVLHGEGDDR